jgi:phi13 family phage major tail protein
MAKIGLKYPCYAILGSTGEYTDGAVIGGAITANITIDSNDIKLYADDAIKETDKSVTGGTISLGVAELTQSVQAILMGHSISGTSMIAKTTDVAPYVGFGFYGTKLVDNVKKYRAIFLKKVQFSEPNDENETKGERTIFKTPTLEGTIMSLTDDSWKIEETFDTEAEAQSFLDNLTGVLPMCASPVASVESGKYAAAQSVELTTTVGDTIYYTTNGITPTTASGTEYTTAIDVSVSQAINAIATKAGYNTSPVATYEYIIS